MQEKKKDFKCTQISGVIPDSSGNQRVTACLNVPDENIFTLVLRRRRTSGRRIALLAALPTNNPISLALSAWGEYSARVNDLTEGLRETRGRAAWEAATEDGLKISAVQCGARTVRKPLHTIDSRAMEWFSIMGEAEPDNNQFDTS